MYSTDVAGLAAQLAAILVIAFMVELRALGLRRALDGKDARVLLGFTFGSFGMLLTVALVVVNGGLDVRGTVAAWAWFLTAAPLLLLTFQVALAGWAGMQISEQDVRKRERSEALPQPAAEGAGMEVVVSAIEGRRVGRVTGSSRPHASAMRYGLRAKDCAHSRPA